MALSLFFASAALPETGAAGRGADYIRTTQLPDGGFGGFGAGQSMDAIFAVRAAGVDPNSLLKDGKSPADFLKANAAGATKPAEAAKAALAARALGIDPRSVAGTDLIAKINAGYAAATGLYAADDFSQSIALIGLACTGNNIPSSAVLALRKTQIDDGGWGFQGASDPDTTGIALQALVAAGAPKSDAAVAKAVAYLKSTQGKDGGWGFDPNESNASSTAFAIQGLLAAGENVETAAYTKTGVNPVTYLISQQNPDGSFKGFDPAFATNQVVPALAGRTFCDASATAIRPAGPAAAVTPARPRAPLPPNTGTGAMSGESATALIAMAVVLLVLAGGAAVTATRKAR